MICKQFKLSQPEKEKLIRIKSRTGIQNWNILCRWALCWSLKEESIPGGVDPQSDSNVEMSWITLPVNTMRFTKPLSGSAASMMGWVTLPKRS